MKTTNKNHGRQGDVGIAKITNYKELLNHLKKIDSIEKIELIPIKPSNHKIILAYGEATGHSHAVNLLDYPDVSLFQIKGSPDMILKVKNPIEIRHEEHLPLFIPDGDYQVDRQHEYDPESEANERSVADWSIN